MPRFTLPTKLRLLPLFTASCAVVVATAGALLDIGYFYLLIVAVSAAGLAGIAAALWIDQRWAQPLERLIHQASELALGRISRAESPQDPELAALAGALNRLAATAEAQFANVRSERDQLRAILTGMSEGVLVVNREGRAELANPALTRLLDLSGEVRGRRILELVRLPELAQLVEDTIARGRGASCQVELPTAERRQLFLTSAALAGEMGAVGGAVVVARDTTELSRVADMRRDFVANVSHELKTPLAAIRGYAETLADGALEEPVTARRFLTRILVQCLRLQELLDDLLTLSRLESLDIGKEREPVDLAEIASGAIELLSPAAREKQVELALRLETELPEVPGEPESLERLFVNLLTNAIKYNRPEGEVEVRLVRDGADAVIEVRDTGIGIPADVLGRIFERFYRVDKGRARDEGGTGLGLAIVKHIAQAHGGTVEVESKIGRGSTFRVRLPLAEGPG